MRVIDRDKLLELCKTKLLIDSKKDTKQFIEDLETLLDLWQDIYVEAIPIEFVEKWFLSRSKYEEDKEELHKLFDKFIEDWETENEHSNSL